MSVIRRIFDKIREPGGRAHDVMLEKLSKLPGMTRQRAENAVGTGMGLAGTTWLSKPQVARAIAQHATAETLGPGTEVIAKGAVLPGIGKVAVKKLRRMKSLFQGLFPDESEKLADKLPRNVPKTQPARGPSGEPYFLQEYVEPPPGWDANKLWEYTKRIENRLYSPQGFRRPKKVGKTIIKMLEKQGIEPSHDFAANIQFGKVRGRTRPWIVDTGTLLDKTQEEFEMAKLMSKRQHISFGDALQKLQEHGAAARSGLDDRLGPFLGK